MEKLSWVRLLDESQTALYALSSILLSWKPRRFQRRTRRLIPSRHMRNRIPRKIGCNPLHRSFEEKREKKYIRAKLVSDFVLFMISSCLFLNFSNLLDFSLLLSYFSRFSSFCSGANFPTRIKSLFHICIENNYFRIFSYSLKWFFATSRDFLQFSAVFCNWLNILRCQKRTPDSDSARKNTWR